MRRVVVTGMGITCALGLGVEHVWRRLINNESGIGSIQSFDTKDVPCKVAGQVPPGVKADGSLDTVELVMAFEEAFGVEIPEDAAEKISTVKDAIEYIEKQKAA